MQLFDSTLFLHLWEFNCLSCNHVLNVFARKAFRYEKICRTYSALSFTVCRGVSIPSFKVNMLPLSRCLDYKKTSKI